MTDINAIVSCILAFIRLKVTNWRVSPMEVLLEVCNEHTLRCFLFQPFHHLTALRNAPRMQLCVCVWFIDVISTAAATTTSYFDLFTEIVLMHNEFMEYKSVEKYSTGHRLDIVYIIAFDFILFSLEKRTWRKVCAHFWPGIYSALTNPQSKNSKRAIVRTKNDGNDDEKF